MVQMVKVKVRWDGFSGAPGWSNFFFKDFTATGDMTQADADGAANRVTTFFDAIKAVLPPAVKTTVQQDVEVIDIESGELQHAFTVSPKPAVAGTNASITFSGASGMVVTWRTGGVRNGRRVRGRTFLVPTSAGIYENDGTIAPATLTTVRTAADALTLQTGSPDLGVYARPKKDEAGNITQGGEWHPVTGATVPDLAAILKSRRD
jgi:hypothetical protein